VVLILDPLVNTRSEYFIINFKTPRHISRLFLMRIYSHDKYTASICFSQLDKPRLKLDFSPAGRMVAAVCEHLGYIKHLRYLWLLYYMHRCCVQRSRLCGFVRHIKFPYM
jgi:hypothetical protein